MPIGRAGGGGGGGGGNSPSTDVAVAVTVPTGDSGASVTVPATQLVTVVDPNTGSLSEEEVAVDFGVGSVVSLVNDGGSQAFRLCSAFPSTGFPLSFFGFLFQAIDPGSSGAVVVSARGSRVQPLIEGGGDLIPGEAVFISATPGKVTHTPPVAVGCTILKVGFAVATDAVVLAPDFSYKV